MGRKLWRDYPSEYATWMMMRQRCENPRNRDWPRYGGRGITVCKRWQSFEAFMEDMGPRPGPDHALTRRSSDLSFRPSTCAWKPRSEGIRRKAGTKLTRKDAERIRRQYKRGVPRVDLARYYEVSLSHICDICSGERWK
jgi:hypothetical protein